MKFLHGFTIDHVDGIAGVTSWASMPETALNLVRDMVFFVVVVEEIITNVFLATVPCVLNIDFVLLGRVRQPFVRKQGPSLLRVISHGRNDGNRIFGKVICVIHEMTGRGDGERCERIDVGNVIKQVAKF